MGLANMGDDIYDDPLLRNPVHHYVDDGRLTFFGTEAFVRSWLPGLVPYHDISKLSVSLGRTNAYSVHG